MAQTLKITLIVIVASVFLLAAPVIATICKPIFVGGKMCQLCCAVDGTSCVVVNCN